MCRRLPGLAPDGEHVDQSACCRAGSSPDRDGGRRRIIFLDLYIAAPLWRRQSLLPHLLGIAGTGQASVALRKLVRSVSVEVVLGLAIVCIVGLLGIMLPANEVAFHRR